MNKISDFFNSVLIFFNSVLICFAEFLMHILDEVPQSKDFKQCRAQWHYFHFSAGFIPSVVWCAIVYTFVPIDSQLLWYWICGIAGTLLFFNIEFQQLSKYPTIEDKKDMATDLNQFMGLWLPVLYCVSGFWTSVIGLGIILIIYISTYKWANP